MKKKFQIPKIPKFHLDAKVGRLLGAVQHQRELLQPTDMLMAGWGGFARLEADHQAPTPARVFAPCVGGHEGPVAGKMNMFFLCFFVKFCFYSDFVFSVKILILF